MKLRIPLICVALFGCAAGHLSENSSESPDVVGPPPPSTVENVKFFYGDIHFRFTDGRLVQSRLLLERRFLLGSAQIIERVWQPRTEAVKPAAESVTRLTMIQRIGTNGEPLARPASTRTAEFAVAVDSELAQGTEVFQGHDWNWTSWSYSLRTRDGSLVRGSGQERKSLMEIHKQYYRNPAELARARSFLEIDEKLREVDEKAFNSIRDQMSSGHWGL